MFAGSEIQKIATLSFYDKAVTRLTFTAHPASSALRVKIARVVTNEAARTSLAAWLQASFRDE
jgi:hypothetical protein